MEVMSCTGLIFYIFNVLFHVFSVYIILHPNCNNPLDAFQRGGISKNIRGRILHQIKIQMDNGGQYEFYIMAENVPEAMTRLVEEKLNSSNVF